MVRQCLDHDRQALHAPHAMSHEQLRALLAETGPILLDFDGPVTRLLPAGTNAELADAAREPLTDAGYELPAELVDTTDHIAVLRFSAGVDTKTRQDVEEICRELEVKAAQHSEPTPGADAFLQACRRLGRPVVIVSNNDAVAIDAYLTLHDLRGLVADVVGRPRGHPELMKSHPEILRQALAILRAKPQDALMIGDTVSDVEASHAAGVRIIGYAKTPSRGESLSSAGANAIVTTMLSLAKHLGEA